MDLKCIVSGCKNAEPESIKALYELYSDRLMRLCMGYVKSEDEAYDLFHDAFLIIISKISQLKDHRKLEAWMGVIVKNLALQHLKRRKKFVQAEEEFDLVEDAYGEVCPPVPLETLMQMVSSLPEQYGKVFRMAVLEGLSHKEIGGILGIEENTSSSNLHRARAILRTALKKYWGGLVLALLLLMTPLLWKEKKMTEQPEYTLAEESEDTVTVKVVSDSIIKPSKSLIMIADGSSVPVARADSVAEEYNTEAAADTVIQEIMATKENERTVNVDTRKPSLENVDWGQEEKKRSRRKGSVRIQFSTLPGSVSRLTAMNQDNGLLAAILPEVDDFTDSPTKIASWSDLEKMMADLAHNYPDSAMYVSLHAIAKSNADAGNEMKEELEYDRPLTLGLTASIEVDEKLSLITGLEYSRLSSKARSGIDTVAVSNRQTVHYIGLPAGVSYSVWSRNKMNLSVSAYGRIDIPLAASSIIEHHNGNVITYSARTPLRAPVQWSVGTGLCFQYSFGGNISIYAEPQIQYHFDTGGKLRTSWTERPLDLAVPVGIRISW
jgi:RNA polymerase sigma-70 factor (ECF subfamily)